MAKTFPKPSYFCIFNVVGIKFANVVKVAIPSAYSFLHGSKICTQKFHQNKWQNWQILFLDIQYNNVCMTVVAFLAEMAIINNIIILLLISMAQCLVRC